MSHLTLESLARLVDEAAEPDEETHLSVCGACRDELDALRAQKDMLASLPAMAPAPDGWPALRERLLDEGLIGDGRLRRRQATLRRIAAAVALFVGGASAGYLARGPVPTLDQPAAVAAAPAGGPDAESASGAARPDGTSSDEARPDRAGRGGTTMAEPGLIAGDPDPTRTPPDVGEAQELFLAALDRYMTENSVRPADPATRLAALDHIVHTTAEALNEAPADPVINSYHLTAVAQRNAILREIAASRGEPVF